MTENEEVKVPEEEKAPETAEEIPENKDCKTEKKKNAKKLQEELDKALAEAEENKRKWYAVTA